jgi:hypothetical protein
VYENIKYIGYFVNEEEIAMPAGYKMRGSLKDLFLNSSLSLRITVW